MSLSSSLVWMGTMAPPAVAPVLSSLNYDQGQVAGGGAPIVITGTGFTGVTGGAGVTFLGTNAASYVVDSDTQITAVLPAHAAGSGNVVVTHPTNGASNTLAFEYWDPASLSATGWWRAPFSASPHVGTASAGASGTRDATEATNPPTVGAALNGYAPPDFNGSQLLTPALSVSDYLANSALTIMTLAKADVAQAPVGGDDKYQDAQIVGSYDTAVFGLAWSTSGVRPWMFDGARKNNTHAQSTGSHFAAFMTYDGTNLRSRLNGGAASQVAVTSGWGGFPSSTMRTGASNLFGSYKFDGTIPEVILLDSVTSDANQTKTRKYFNQRYALTLT